MKTLSLKTPNIIESLVILENYDIIEVLKIKDNVYNYYSHLQKVVSDVPFQVYNYSDVLITTTTEFISNQSNASSYFKIKGTQVNQIIYIKHYKNRLETVYCDNCRIIKLTAIPQLALGSCIIEDIPHQLKGLESYNTIDIDLDLSKIKGGSTNSLIIQNTNLKLLDISNVAKEFKKFQIVSCYVGNINIVDFFADKTYSTIALQSSDFIGDICDLVQRYFNNNRFLTIVFDVNTTEITLHNKSIIGRQYFQIVINESGATISKGTSLSGPFEETILTYNGSTWEGSWLQ